MEIDRQVLQSQTIAKRAIGDAERTNVEIVDGISHETVRQTLKKTN